MNQTILKNDKLFNLLQSFFYGKFYPIYLGLFTLLFYSMQIPIVAFVFFMTLSCVTLICFRDLTPFTPLPMLIIMSLSSFDFFTDAIILVVIFIALFVGSLTAHLFIYPIKKFVFGKLFVPFCLITVGLLCGGLFSPYLKNDYLRGLPTILSVAPAMFLVYVLYKNYSNPPKDFNHVEHLFFVLLIVGTTLSLIMFVHEYYSIIGIFGKYNMGFGNTNIYACALVMLTPFSWYFICTKKKFLPFVIILVLNYLAIYLSRSDGVLALAFAFIPVFAVLGYIKTDEYHKNIFLKTFLIGCFIIVLGLLVLATKINLNSLLTKLISKLSTDNGRTELYVYALELFKKYPIFGTSFGIFELDKFPLLPSPEGETYIVYTMSFHSTFFHLLATTGLVGLITYAIYYVVRYKVLMKKNSIYNLVAFLSFTLYQIYGMISHEEFQAFPILIFSTILLSTIELSNNENKQPTNLPLLKKNIKYQSL